MELAHACTRAQGSLETTPPSLPPAPFPRGSEAVLGTGLPMILTGINAESQAKGRKTQA